MNHWILKTEPSSYGFDDLVREGTAVWDGVKNHLALRHLRAMQPGDRVIIYHSGSDKAAIGLATVVSAACPDPHATDDKLVAVKVQAGPRFATPVTLAVVKADPAFTELALVRMPRLSVMPATAAQYARLVALGAAAR